MAHETTPAQVSFYPIHTESESTKLKQKAPKTEFETPSQFYTVSPQRADTKSTTLPPKTHQCFRDKHRPQTPFTYALGKEAHPSQKYSRYTVNKKFQSSSKQTSTTPLPHQQAQQSSRGFIVKTESTPKVKNQVTYDDNYHDVRAIIEIFQNDWSDLAKNLGFTQDEISEIQTDRKLRTGGAEPYFSKVLSCWLEWKPKDSRDSVSFPTIDALIQALSKMNDTKKATYITQGKMTKASNSTRSSIDLAIQRLTQLKKS
ncbi:hypothetical protein D5R81_08080 [Parashewanella spongiae]|uniref:Death domain-containing protein n=1 Tax=Parashewanella spongiae TaxID=342950 RepID=A0A3A6U6Q5_9GAMM|nr:hypothetical protein [Parashewanella spongiae]MCL1077916.1 hypothetical protein [Parashewanella spongiae]RJY17559.1 hypothetical protein D5R81_08080 [Parashewanella spongiae]